MSLSCRGSSVNREVLMLLLIKGVDLIFEEDLKFLEKNEELYVNLQNRCLLECIEEVEDCKG
jgi:hypothetical protein